MIEVKLTLSLPDALARAARSAGLLSPEAIQALLSEEVRRRNVEALFSAAERLAEVDPASLSLTEIEAEIQAARQARRGSAGSR
jgi:hypothetical protein